MVVALLSSRSPNLLVFPAGALPGYDPTHVAAISSPYAGDSYVAMPSGLMVSAMRGGLVTSIAASATAPAFSFDGVIGPSLSFAAASTNHLKSGAMPTTTDNSVTMAAILVGTAITSGYKPVYCARSDGLGWALSFNAGAVDVRNGVSDVASSLVVSNAIPYFMAASCNQTTFNYILLRLDNGKLLTASAAKAGTTATNSANHSIGNFTTGNNFPCQAKIATIMYAPGNLNLQQLSQWAADPWSYWYPAPRRSWVGAITSVIVPPSAAKITGLMVLP